MKGNIVDLKFWRPEWATKVFDWYESGEYQAFFRNISGFAYRDSFVNYPQMTSQLVFGIFGEKINSEGPIGLVTVYDYDPNSRIAFAGVMVDKKYHELGVATDAFITAFKYLFTVKGLRKICVEFLGSDEKITHLFVKFGKLVKKPCADDATVEKTAFWEGARKKQALVSGQYHDVVMLGVFKNQFEEMIDKWEKTPVT